MVFGLMAFEEILIISVILAFITALLYRLLINQGELRKLKGEMKFYQDKIKGAQKGGDREAVSKLSSDMLKLSSRQFRMTMKPLMVTGLVFLLIIGWIAAQYGEAVIAAPFAIPFLVVDSQFTWFWWYVIIVLAANIMFRKLLGVD
jgi:uncharacterized membrane protein (DUF106 family)